jgi:hypothetical protein
MPHPRLDDNTCRANYIDITYTKTVPQASLVWHNLCGIARAYLDTITGMCVASHVCILSVEKKDDAECQ